MNNFVHGHRTFTDRTFNSTLLNYPASHVIRYELKEQHFVESRFVRISGFMMCGDVEIFHFDVIFAVAVLGRN